MPKIENVNSEANMNTEREPRVKKSQEKGDARGHFAQFCGSFEKCPPSEFVFSFMSLASCLCQRVARCFSGVLAASSETVGVELVRNRSDPTLFFANNDTN